MSIFPCILLQMCIVCVLWQSHRVRDRQRKRGKCYSTLMLVFRLLRPTTNHKATRISIGVAISNRFVLFVTHLSYIFQCEPPRFPNVCVCILSRCVVIVIIDTIHIVFIPMICIPIQIFLRSLFHSNPTDLRYDLMSVLLKITHEFIQIHENYL